MRPCRREERSSWRDPHAHATALDRCRTALTALHVGVTGAVAAVAAIPVRFDPMNATSAPDDDRSLSALPSVGIRVGAFVAILLSGLAGGIIGYSLAAIQCDGSCGLQKGIGVLIGALMAAGGMAIVAVLVMRAVGEWREVEDRTAAGHAPR